MIVRRRLTVLGALGGLLLGACSGPGRREVASGRSTTTATLAIASRDTPSPDGLVTAPFFSSSSEFNQRIPLAARIDAGSSEMVALLRTSDAPPIVNLFEFGIPMFVASATDPLRQIRCTMPWGVCAPSRRSPLRVPDAAVPNNGSDGSMVIIDAVNHRTIELWQAQRQPNGDLSASWGSINDLHGTGHTGAGGSGSAISRVAGVVRLDEFASGTIPHALAVSSSYACRDRFRPPANQTDGISDLPACLPEGTRLQLDPTIDLNSISGLTPGEQIIGRTLQMYGAYVVDRGGAPLAFAFQRAPDANSVDDPGTVYRAAGLSWDYFGLRKLPWDRLQVLARWDGR